MRLRWCLSRNGHRRNCPIFWSGLGERRDHFGHPPTIDRTVRLCVRQGRYARPVPIDPLSAGLEIVPLAGEHLARFVARNEVGKLFRLVEADVRKQPLPPGSTELVVATISGLRTDPTVAGGLMRLLDGDASAKEGLRARLSQLLVFDDLDFDASTVVDLALRAIETNLHRAKRDDREAGHLEAERIRADIQEIPRRVTERLNAESSMASPQPMLRAVKALADLRPDQTEVLTHLERDDPSGAAKVQEALSAGGPQRIADLIENPQSWLNNGSAALWGAVGRLAESIGRLVVAQQAYEHAAEHPGIADGPRQLVRAAHVANVRGNGEHAKALLDRVRQSDPKNPAILLYEARLCDDSDEAIELLSEVTAADNGQAVQKELTRAGHLIARDEFNEARKAVQDVRKLAPSNRGADEMDALVDLIETQRGLGKGDEPVASRMRSAGETFESLLREAVEEERWDIAGILAGRAIQAYALGGSGREAEELLNEALENEQLRANPEGRRALAQGALLIRRFEDVLSLIPESEQVEDRLERAAALIWGGSAASPMDVVSGIRDLITSDRPERHQAAFLVLCAASDNLAVPWDEVAEKVVTEDRPLAAAFLRAERHVLEGDLDEAEALLRANSDEPDALRFLVHIAYKQARPDRVLRFAKTLVERTGSASDRILLAKALAQDGQQATAIEQLRALARDPKAGQDEQRRAYGLAASLLQEKRDFGELERLSREWSEVDSDSYPRWLVVMSLAARFRHDDALTAWRELQSPAADSENRALLLTEVFALAAEPVEALETIASLSDRYGRPERLEVALMQTALRIERVAPVLPEELEARVRESFNTFPERFPNSTSMRTLAIDPDDPLGSFGVALGDQLQQRADHAERELRNVRLGISPVAVLSTSAGRSVGEILMYLPALPLAYPDQQFDQLDRADAADAYETGAAVWDAAAIYCVAALGNPVEKTFRTALPSSTVAHATQAEAASDTIAPKSSGSGQLFLHNGVLRFSEQTEHDRQSKELRATEMLRLARDLPAAEAPSPTASDDETTKRLRTIMDHDAPRAVRGWAETLAIVRAEGIGIYSDDRAVRASARQLGLKTFGTLAFLDVLAERKQIEGDIRDKARMRLLANGAWGAQPSVDELAELAKASDWQPTPGLRAAFSDTSAWLAGGARWADVILGFLDRVSSHVPAQMDVWAHRAVDALTEAVGGNYTNNSVGLLLVALNPIDRPARMSDPGLRAFITSLRKLAYFRYFRPPEDLLVSATRTFLEGGDSEHERAIILKAILGRLDEEDQTLLRDRFIR